MAKKKSFQNNPGQQSIRDRAEELLRAQPAQTPTLPTADVQALLHELGVHQMELEIQNEELRQAQLDLAHSRDRYSDLYEFAPVGYVTLQEDGGIIEANLTAATMLGVARESFVGTNITRWLDAGSQDICYLHRQAVFASYTKQTCEVCFQKSDGTRLGIRLESIALGPGKVPQCRTALIDVTATRLAQQELMESEQRYRRLTTAVTDYIYRVRIEHGQVLGTEHGANCEAITGYTPAEFQSNPMLWIAMVPVEDRPIIEQQIAEVIKGIAPPPVEHRIVRKGGQISWVMNTISLEFDQRGRLVAYDGLLRDISERKKIEAALEQLNHTLEERVARQIEEVHLMAEALASLGEGVMITTNHIEWPEPNIVYVNAALCRTTGYSKQELIGQSPSILQGDLTDTAIIRKVRREITEGHSHECEVINYRKDGTPYHAELFVSPLCSPEGQHTHTIVIHRDITQRKQLEEEARRQLELNEGIINTAQNIILLLDQQGRISEFNHFAEEITGWRFEEVQGRDWFETFIPAEDRPALQKLFRQALKGNSTHGNVNTILTKDGKRRLVEWYGAQLTNADGELIGLLSSGHDITEKKIAEESLRASEERLRSILKTAADAIITIDESGIINSVNAATEQMFGYSEGELLGQNVKMLMPAPYSEEHDGYIARYLKTGKARIIGIGREVTGLRKDGSHFPISLAVSQVNQQGLFTGIVRDITERRLLQQYVTQAASDEQRRIGQDLHDGVGQELTGLGLMADALVSLTTSDQENQNVEVRQISEKIANGIKCTLKQVRALSRGLVPVQIDPQGLSSALHELAVQITDYSGIECELHDPVPVAVYDSETATQLYRITQEAITNAMKHGHAKRIVVSLHRDGDEITLEIQDDGVGLDGQSQSIQNEGIGISKGMGLRIMRHRAWLIGGHLTVSDGELGGIKVLCQFNVSET